MNMTKLIGALLVSLVSIASTSPAWAVRSTTFLYNDALGTPIAAADESGNVLWRKVYSPFGEEVGIEASDAASTVRDDRGFTGHTYDRESQLVYMGARYYNPRLAVFYSTDPADVVPGNPMSFNRYIYANQNPTRYVDPDGELPVLIPLAIMAYRAYSAYDTAKQVYDTVQMIRDPNTTSRDLAMAGATALASAVAGRVGGKLLKVAAPYAGRAAKGLRRALSRCSANSFAAGTLVHTPEGAKPIELLELGDRVLTIQGGSSESDSESWEVGLRLVPEEDPSDIYLIRLLRPWAWLQERQIAAIGAQFDISSSDSEIRGIAIVESLSPFSATASHGRATLATIAHASDDLYNIRFSGTAEQLRATGKHPVFSLDRNDWVWIRDLDHGERLQTYNGAVAVESIEKIRGVHPVFNIEVDVDREYLVGELALRVHNTCYRGGSHRRMSATVGDGLDSHHMPDKMADPSVSSGSGPAIQMDPVDHRSTSSWGSGRAARRYAQETADMIANGRYRDAMAREIRDVRRVARQAGNGRKYNGAIREMIQYARTSGQLPGK